jgi:hypothetical protein
MDVAAFDGWLRAIAALTPRQRQQAWQTLALSEASAGDAIETGPPRGVDSASSGPAATPVAQPLNRLGSDVVAELGQRRVEAARTARAAMLCIGARRALCRATGAKAVSGPSTR